MDNSYKKEIFLRKVVEIFFIYMIMEGVIRKWIVPEFSTQLYFLKDIFLIFIYLIALKYNLIFKLKFSKSFIFIILLISLYGLTGYNLDNKDIISYILGVRSYWLFLPLFLIVIHIYNRKFLIKFVRLNLYMIIPNFFLIYLQSELPETSILNNFNGTQLSPERPAGFFTYTTQNTYYYLFLFVSYWSFILSKKEFFYKEAAVLVLLGFLLICTMILLKSRAVYVYTFFTLLVILFYLIFSNEKNYLKLIKFFFILMLSFSFYVVSNFIFKKDFEYSKKRLHTDTIESMSFVMNAKNKQTKFFGQNVYEFCKYRSSLCRLVNELNFISAISKTSVKGMGIGAGTAGVTSYKKTQAFSLGETENSRIVMELGFLIGSLFVLTKIIITIILNIISLLKIRDNQNLMYIPILIFVSIQILIGPITYTTSFISFVFWYSLGLLFSSFKNTRIVDTKYL